MRLYEKDPPLKGWVLNERGSSGILSLHFGDWRKWGGTGMPWAHHIAQAYCGRMAANIGAWRYLLPRYWVYRFVAGTPPPLWWSRWRYRSFWTARGATFNEHGDAVFKQET